MTAFPALDEAQGKLHAVQKALNDVFAEAGPEMDMGQIKSLDGDSQAKIEWIRAKNAEMDELGAKIEALQDVAKAAERSRQRDSQNVEPGAEPGGSMRQAKSFADLFIESQAFKGKQGAVGPEARLDVELKTLLDTGTGWAPETTRGPRVVDFVTTPLQVADIIPSTTTTQTAITFMEETTFTNNAAAIAEGGPYPEAALAFTERTSPVRKIGVWLPVTDEQLEDVPQIRGYINNRLPFMVRQRLDAQILTGSGNAPNLRGILNTTGIQTEAVGGGTDNSLNAIYRALVKVRVNGQAVPNAIVMNPMDWQDVRLLRTTDGIYLYGSPSEAGTPRMWGLPVVEAQALTENTALVGDFQNFSELATRRGIDVQISNSHADLFINGQQAIRADMRVALVIYRPAAFATVTSV
jgi:HK97 family phage major capsid protein